MRRFILPTALAVLAWAVSAHAEVPLAELKGNQITLAVQQALESKTVRESHAPLLEAVDPADCKYTFAAEPKPGEPYLRISLRLKKPAKIEDVRLLLQDFLHQALGNETKLLTQADADTILGKKGEPAFETAPLPGAPAGSVLPGLTPAQVRAAVLKSLDNPKVRSNHADLLALVNLAASEYRYGYLPEAKTILLVRVRPARSGVTLGDIDRIELQKFFHHAFGNETGLLTQADADFLLGPTGKFDEGRVTLELLPDGPPPPPNGGTGFYTPRYYYPMAYGCGPCGWTPYGCWPTGCGYPVYTPVVMWYPPVVPAWGYAPTLVPAIAEAKPTGDPAARAAELLKGKRAADAPGLFWAGVGRYFQRDHTEALAYLTAATTLDTGDARYWYYRSLSERALGDATAARLSARRGAALEAMQPGQAEPVRTALERVQGPTRTFLRESPDLPIDPVKVAEIAAGRDPLAADRSIVLKKTR